MTKKSSDDVGELSAVEREIDALRERTEELLGELDERIDDRLGRARTSVRRVRSRIERVRHAVDLPAQARAHPNIAVAIGVGASLAGGALVYRLLSARAATLQRKLVAAFIVNIAATLVRQLTAATLERPQGG